MSQATTEAASAETTTESIARTVVTPLETSDRKLARIDEQIELWQEMLSYLSDMWPSLDKRDWGNTQAKAPYRWLDREFGDVFDDNRMYKMTARMTYRQIASNYQTWRSNGKPGDRPAFDGDGNWIEIYGEYLDLVPNDRGYGLKVKLEPYGEPEWFHCRTSDYHDEYFERVCDSSEPASLGASQLRRHDGGLDAHLVATDEVEVYEPDDVDRIVGVDIGERLLYAAGVLERTDEWSRETADAVTARTKSGARFREHREWLSGKQQAAQEKGNIERVYELRGQRRRYTEQELRTAANEIVDLALEHEPSLIAVEDLTGYRESAQDPIHDMPYAEFRDAIVETATDAGVPVESVDPAYTSQTCRRCGHEDETARDGARFECPQCGYDIDADVNAAFNIALRGGQSI